MDKKITFTDITQTWAYEQPQPASKFIPDWYKKMESYIGGKKEYLGNGNTTSTIKKCIPVLDAITAGYIITLPSDVYVSQKEVNGETVQWFDWVSNNQVSFHTTRQAPTHPKANSNDYPKWMNIWAIKTPPGYSSLFVQPFHRESFFTILPGVVDTDTYNAVVNFPFVMNDLKWEGLIPAGTPIAQVIPFKRDSWKMVTGTEKDFKEQNKIYLLINSQFFNKYKRMFWHRKEYK